MTEYLRVRWLATGHHSTIPAHRYDSKRHARLQSPAVDRNGDRVPPKYRADLGTPASAPSQTPDADVVSDSKAGTATKATDDTKES